MRTFFLYLQRYQTDVCVSNATTIQLIPKGLSYGSGDSVGYYHSTFQGNYVEMSTSIVQYQGRNVVQGVLRDVTERERLHRQLEQAQKMESVGRLAGGVAHDFNNMLAVILGRTEMMLLNTKPEDQNYAGLTEIHSAAVRSSNLTKQLVKLTLGWSSFLAPNLA